MSTMPTDRKVVLVIKLTLIIAVTIQSVASSKVLTLSDESDDENTLKQALYLVKLLKSDYMKSLRENSDLDQNDEANSTCPEDAANSTTPYYISVVTESLPPAAMAPTPVPAAAPGYGYAQPAAPPAPQVPPAAVPPVNYPPQPMIQFTQAGVMPPAENINFPYRRFHRRMMPDYGYYDVLLSRYTTTKLSSSDHSIRNSMFYTTTGIPAHLRRFDYDAPIYAPPFDRNIQVAAQRRSLGYYNPASEPPILSGYRRLGDAGLVTNVSADTVAVTTTVAQAANGSEGTDTLPTTLIATDKEDNETSGSLTNVTEATQPLTSLLPETNQSLLSNLSETNQSLPTTMLGTSQSLLTNLSESNPSLPTTSSETNQSLQTASPTTTQYSPTRSSETVQTIPNTLSPPSSAETSSTQSSTVPTLPGNTKHGKHSRSKFTKIGKKRGPHRKKKTTTDKPTSEDVIMSAVASELIVELKRSTTEHQSDVLRQRKKKKNIASISPKSTMKIYLRGSSRMPIPLPENNAFCHLYPQSKLCSAGI